MSDRQFAGRWIVEDDSGVLFGPNGWTPVAGAGRRPGGYVGWIWPAGAAGALRMVQTDTVPTLEDAMRAADELLLAQAGGERREAGDGLGQHRCAGQQEHE